MSRLKKQVQKRGLASVQTWITDTNPFSDYFRLTQIPDTIPGGKSGFLINGAPELVRATEVLVELIDANGNPIFVTPVKNYQEGLARVISIEVYDDTPPGPATLTILGEIAFDKNGNRSPDQWIGTYNVKWQQTINIEPNKPNTTPIRLYNKPVLSVTERLVPYRQTVTGSIVSISTGSITGQYIAPNVQLVGSDPANLQRLVTQAGTQLTALPIFSRPFAGGTFYATILGYPFTASIESVQSSTAAKLTQVFTSSDGTIAQNWTTANYNIVYQNDPTYITQSLKRSFANIALTNLTTFTGDIQRAKLYVRGADEGQKYDLLQEVVLEDAELTVTQSNAGEIVSMGSITDPTFLSQYWHAGTIPYTTNVSTSLTYDTKTLLDSVHLTGVPISTFTGSAATSSIGWFGINQAFSFDGNAEYTFTGDFIGLKTDATYESKLEVRLYGPAFVNTDTTGLGLLLTTFTVPVGQTLRSFHDFNLNFITPLPDNAHLQFVTYGGDWFVANPKISSVRETGFNPDSFSVLSSVVGRRFERLQFKAELYDANNSLVPLLIETNPIYFDGGNLVVRGSDNRVDGVLTVAPSGSGPTLTTRGFYNRSGTFTPGQAISIGSLIPQVKNKNTAFFAGTSSFGPEISVGDKLYGYYDTGSNQFILQIEGQLLIGDGSGTLTDIRNVIPRVNSDQYFSRITGSIGDFYDLRGRYAVTAGEVDNQIARMGNYTRNRFPPVKQTPVTMSGFTSSYDAYNTSTKQYVISKLVYIPPNIAVVNNTIYVSSEILLNETAFGLPYSINYLAYVQALWDNGTPTSPPGPQYAGESQIYIVSSSMGTNSTTFKFPVSLPTPRTGNTMSVQITIDLNTTPTT